MISYNFMDHVNLNPHDPLISYYKSEYKQDWMLAYSDFIESSRKEKRRKFLLFFKKMIHGFVHPKQTAIEEHLAQGKTHHDVDILQRNMMQKSVI